MITYPPRIHGNIDSDYNTNQFFSLYTPILIYMSSMVVLACDEWDIEHKLVLRDNHSFFLARGILGFEMV